ncbi:hypothetical protein AVEN_264673-1 [Araneus ventricosus]|uniref:Uncharacterized protein n=1 Tax=Araneus ventricosus TaxID=182803 RepID=A0A4Y2JJS3_ARAVE|nr:hypothetical protein AVEN_264673-1 [Araneus ventricosus]
MISSLRFQEEIKSIRSPDMHYIICKKSAFISHQSNELSLFSKPTSSPARLQLDCSENVDEEAVGQWINKDSTLECFEVLSDDDIVSRVTSGSEETRNFEECPESDEESLVTHQKLSHHGDALVHTGALLNYLDQEDESTPAEKMILRNLSSTIRRRVNEKQKQTSTISFFTKQ